MDGHQLLGELRQGTGRPLLPLPLARGAAQPVVLDHEAMETLERVLLVADPIAEVRRSRPDGLLEQRQQQLLLPAEVLIEAPQGLP